jgi:hypothetical protein
MQKNPDGSTLYWISVTNNTAVPVTFHFRGSAL